MTSVCFLTSDGSSCAVGYSSGRITLWNTRNGCHGTEFTRHKDAINVLKVNDDMTLLCSGSNDKTAKLFKAETLEVLFSFSLESIVSAIAFDGKLVFIGIRGSNIKAFHVETYKEMHRLAKHEGRVQSIVALHVVPPGVNFELYNSGSFHVVKCARTLTMMLAEMKVLAERRQAYLGLFRRIF